MTFRDRLQPQITLTSPSGIEFIAKWIGNERRLDKRLGVFKTPGVSGVIVQDLAVEGAVYPLTIFFDGPDNDLESNRFFTACRETGQWVVIHPVHGEKTLQLVSVSEAVQPITSGGVTEFSTEWLEVLTDAGAKTAQQLAAEALAQSESLRVGAAGQFEEIVKLDTADKAGKLKTATENTVSAFSATLESITATVAEVQAQVDSIKRGIDATVFGPLTDVLALAGQIQALIATPQLIITDLKTKFATYDRFLGLILDTSPESASPGGINTAAVQEISLTAALGALGVSSATTPLNSRQNSIDGIDSMLQFFDDMTDGLDTVQDVYAAELLRNAYFSQSQSFLDAARMSALAMAFLLKSTFDLSVEKRITLTRAENPVMMALREYEGPGESDSNIDLFYDSNNLTGQETLILPVGKEIVVYLPFG